MTEHDEKMLDKKITDAWSDVKVTDDLKASTMAAIHRSLDSQGEDVPDSSSPFPPTPSLPTPNRSETRIREGAGYSIRTYGSESLWRA